MLLDYLDDPQGEMVSYFRGTNNSGKHDDRFRRYQMKKHTRRMMAMLICLAMLAAYIPTTVFAADPFPSWNVAEGKAVTVSSVENAMPQNVGQNVVDGDTGTRWSSEAMKAGGVVSEDVAQTPQWLVIDLQASQTQVESITIHFYKKVWGAKYRIETADTNNDATQWETVKSFDHTAGSVADDYVERITDVTTLKRYVRFYFEKVNPNAAGTGVSITELQIQGKQLVTGNLALNKKVYASTVEILMPQNVGTNVVDGSDDTRWSSEKMKESWYTDANDQTAQWLIIDLEAPESVLTDITIKFYLKVWATKYRIDTADTRDAQEWTQVAQVSRSSDGSADVIDTFSGEDLDTTTVKRFIRFYFEKINVNAGGTGVSVREIQVNGTQKFLAGSMEPTSAAEAIRLVTALDPIDVDTTQVPLPEMPEGFEIAVVGSDKEQVISNDGTITHRNIGDRTVTLLLEARQLSDTGEVIDKARKNLDVVVPSKNEKYPALFPTVEDPNEKPVVIPTLQEWYGYEGGFTLTGQTRIVVDDRHHLGLDAVAQRLQEDLAEFAGVTPEIVTGTSCRSEDIYLGSLGEDLYDVGDEGYFITIDEAGVRIYAHTYTGVLYGTVTCEQILWQDEDHDTIPCGVIRDYPDYQIRGVMFDVGRIPHRLQYLEDYTKILTWYKMNEFQLHLNDDFTYSPEGLPSGNAWNGMHRLESDAFPSLTENRVYTNSENVPEGRFDYFNEVYADPIYSKADYRKLEALANAGGIELVPEFDTPSHSNAYISYAQENPDDIDWLGPIQSRNDPQQLALNINSADPNEAQKARTARRFIQTLYEDYLAGEDPVFNGKYVNIGADEYWDKSDPESYRQYVVFLNELMEKYGKTTRMWGALKVFPGNTYIDPSNIILDIWATYEDDPTARLAEGFRVVNIPQPYLYTTPGRNHKDMVVEDYLFRNWDPTIFNGNICADPGEPLLLGAKAALWGDEFREGITEADLHERALRAVAITAEKTWGGSEKTDDYLTYQQAFDCLQEGPGTQIANQIDSKTDVVVDYDVTQATQDGDTVVIPDVSGNGYDARLTGGQLVEVDGQTMIAFDGDCLMTTPLRTLSYPYTISFDIRAATGNTSDSLLFSGYDGQLLAQGLDDDLMSLNRMFYHQSFGYQIPTDDTVTITIVGTARNTKLYVDGTLVKMLYSSDTGQSDEYFSTFVFPMEQIGENFHGYISNIKAYNKALDAELVRADGASIEQVNIALNRNAYSGRFGTTPELNSGDMKYHPASKATDGDLPDSAATMLSTDPNSYWLSTNNDTDYLLVDLGKVQRIDRVKITWESHHKASAFDIQVSNDRQTWTTIQEVRGNSAQANDLILDAPVEARYVKLQGVKRAATWYGVREIQIFQSVDKTGLKEALAQLPTDHTWTEALKEAVIDANTALNSVTADQDQIDQALAALTAALEDQPSHDLAYVEGKDPTCTEPGNKEYWHCTACGKYFEDASGTKEIALEDTVLPAKGHTPVTVPGKEATCTEDGLTEGIKCSACDHVIQAQQTIPATGHHFEDGVCTDCGVEDPDYVPPTDPGGEPLPPTGDVGMAWPVVLASLCAVAYVLLRKRAQAS